jgi:hypothetical protein
MFVRQAGTHQALCGRSRQPLERAVRLGSDKAAGIAWRVTHKTVLHKVAAGTAGHIAAGAETAVHSVQVGSYVAWPS